MTNTLLPNLFKSHSHPNLRAVFSEQSYFHRHLAHMEQTIAEVDGELVQIDFDENSTYANFTLLRDELVLFLNHDTSSVAERYPGGELLFNFLSYCLPNDIRTKVLNLNNQFHSVDEFIDGLFTALSDEQEECEDSIDFLSRLSEVLITGHSKCNRDVHLSHLLTMIDIIRFNSNKADEKKPKAVMLLNFRFNECPEHSVAIKMCMTELFRSARKQSISFQEVVISNELIPYDYTTTVMDNNYPTPSDFKETSELHYVELQCIKETVINHLKIYYLPLLRFSLLQRLVSPIRFLQLSHSLDKSRFEISKALSKFYQKRALLHELLKDDSIKLFETELRLIFKMAS